MKTFEFLNLNKIIEDEKILNPEYLLYYQYFTQIRAADAIYEPRPGYITFDHIKADVPFHGNALLVRCDQSEFEKTSRHKKIILSHKIVFYDAMLFVRLGPPRGLWRLNIFTGPFYLPLTTFNYRRLLKQSNFVSVK